MSITRVCGVCGFTGTYTNPAMASHHHRRHSCAKRLRRRELTRRRAQRAACEPKRECRHPRTRHRHGTRAAYVRDRCRCRACTAANTAASNRTHRARTFGRWEPFTDAEPVRAHIRSLRAAGIGINQIATLAGLSPSHVRGLIYPRPGGKPPYQRVRPATADRILAVPATDTSRAANSRVDATGTRRRLQALAANGWTATRLARHLHRTPTSLRRSMASPSVTAGTARAVRDLFDRLWDATPPHRTAAQRAASDTARAHAARHRWLPPLAWDDIDHDPEPEQPTNDDDAGLDEIAIERAMAGDTRVPLTHAERLEAVHRLTARGRSIRTIAELLGTSTRTISRHRHRTSAA